MDWTIQSRRYLVSDKKVEAVNYRKKNNPEILQVTTQ